jgi:hypothetical protein
VIVLKLSIIAVATETFPRFRHILVLTISLSSVRPCRPLDLEQTDLFNGLCEMMESCDSELCTLTDLREKLKVLAGRDDVYCERTLQNKLKEKYGESISVTGVSGHKNVVCFRNLALHIVSEKWYAERDTDPAKETERIIVTAAKLLKSSIQASLYDNSKYPATSSAADTEEAKQWVPKLLQLFMENIVNDDLKQVAISHAIVQAAVHVLQYRQFFSL